jgi:hypothetical protein
LYDIGKLVGNPVEATGAVTFYNAKAKLNYMSGIFMILDLNTVFMLVKAEILSKIYMPKKDPEFGDPSYEDLVMTCSSAVQRESFIVKLSEFNGHSAIFGDELDKRLNRLFTSLADATEYIDNCKEIRDLEYLARSKPSSQRPEEEDY